jgi:branched-chain amino acid aminotransferase
MTEFSNTASVDGVVTSLAEARVPIMDRGFLYGDSIYEVFRTYRGVPLFYEEHWRRLENSASLIGMAIGYSAFNSRRFSTQRRAKSASST